MLEEESPSIGRAVLVCCLELVLIGSLFRIPKATVDAGSVKHVKKCTAWVTLPFVEALGIKVSKHKPRIHFVVDKVDKDENTCSEQRCWPAIEVLNKYLL